MEILGIFIGTLYLWTTSDPIISSILSIFFGGAYRVQYHERSADRYIRQSDSRSGPLPADSDQLSHRKQLDRILRPFFLTRKICLGRPWVLAFFIMLGSMLMGAFMGGFPDLLILPHPL